MPVGALASAFAFAVTVFLETARRWIQSERLIEHPRLNPAVLLGTCLSACRTRLHFPTNSADTPASSSALPRLCPLAWCPPLRTRARARASCLLALRSLLRCPRPLGISAHPHPAPIGRSHSRVPPNLHGPPRSPSALVLSGPPLSPITCVFPSTAFPAVAPAPARRPPPQATDAMSAGSDDAHHPLPSPPAKSSSAPACPAAPGVQYTRARPACSLRQIRPHDASHLTAICVRDAADTGVRRERRPTSLALAPRDGRSRTPARAAHQPSPPSEGRIRSPTARSHPPRTSPGSSRLLRHKGVARDPAPSSSTACLPPLSESGWPPRSPPVPACPRLPLAPAARRELVPTAQRATADIASYLSGRCN